MTAFSCITALAGFVALPVNGGRVEWRSDVQIMRFNGTYRLLASTSNNLLRETDKMHGLLRHTLWFCLRFSELVHSESFMLGEACGLAPPNPASMVMRCCIFGCEHLDAGDLGQCCNGT